MITIDKSRFNAAQLAQYEALVAIGKADVDPEAAEEEMQDDKPDVPPKKTKKAEVDDMEETKKSATEAALEAVQAELAAFKKSAEMKEFADIAKKYAPLGKKEDELAQQLYDMKKSSESSYDAFVSVLDEHLALVEKSGLFGEIGKSAGNATAGGSVQAKIEAKAQDIMKSDANMDYNTAVAKAWETSPELMAEYDAEYRR